MSPKSASTRLFDIPSLENDASNFRDWKYRVKTVLGIRDLWKYVSGDVPRPSDPLLESDWVINDREALGQIALTLKPVPLDGILHITTSKAAWDRLMARYEGKGKQTIALLFLEIFNTPLTEDEPLETQLSVMRNKAHILKTLEHEIPDALLAVMAINLLPESYNTLKTILTQDDDKKLVFDTVVERILTEEKLRTANVQGVALFSRSRQNGSQGKNKFSSSSHNSSSNSNNTSSDKKKVKCEYCKKKNHTKAECRKRIADEAAAKGSGSDEKKAGGRGGSGSTESSSSTKTQNAKSALAQTASYTSSPPRVSLKLLFSNGGSRVQSTDKWIIDSGASSPMTSNRNWFISLRPLSPPVRIMLGDDRHILATGIGRIRLDFTLPDGSVSPSLLTQALYVPDLQGNNLLSVSNLVSQGYEVSFANKRCEIRDKDGAVWGFGKLVDKIYVLEAKTIPREMAALSFTDPSFLDPNDDLDLSKFDVDQLALVSKAKTSTASFHTWHRRLGHINTRYIQKLVSEGMVEGMAIDGDAPSHEDFCKTCVFGKQTREPIPKVSTLDDHQQAPLYRVHSDVCGPMEVESIGGHHYFVVFVDGYSNYITVKPIRLKSEVLRHFKYYVARMELETGDRVTRFRSDGGGEFKSKEFEVYLLERGIHWENSNRDTPQENGKAERTIRKILDVTRPSLYEADIPHRYWNYAVEHAAYVLNRVPSRSLSESDIGDLTPYEAMFGVRPDVSHIRVFGSNAYAHVPKHLQKKLGERSIECVHLGYAEHRKSYILLEKIVTKEGGKKWGRIIESRDVKFDEGEYFTRVLITDEDELVITEESKGGTKKEEEDSSSQKSDASNTNTNIDTTTSASRTKSSPSPTPSPSSVPAVETRRTMPARTRRAPVKDDDSRYEVTSYKRRRKTPTVEASVEGPKESGSTPDTETVTSVGESPETANAAKQSKGDSKDSCPQTYDEALARDDADQWVAAFNDEFEAFDRQNLYTTCDLPKGRKPVDARWVLAWKKDAEGNIIRPKARIVAKGFSQVTGIDYDATFSPVTRHSTIRTLLALAARNKWHIHQIDFKSAFTNSPLDREIYMKIPKGHKDYGKGKVWRLNKALYGLKQASREWYLLLKKEVTELKYKVSDMDPGVFYRIDGGNITILAFWVDDGLIISTSLDSIEGVKTSLGSNYQITDLGEATWYLGMSIKRDFEGRRLALSQEAYVENILARFGMDKCRPVSTPMDPNTKLPSLLAPEVDQTDYQSRVGALMHLMVCTRPDIAYAVGMVARHSHAPGRQHLLAVNRIFRYLRGTSDLALIYDGSKAPFDEPDIYSDADWAGEDTSRKSTSGMVTLLSGAAVSWGSKKQSVVALSSTEAEFIAATTAAREAVWFRELFSSLNFVIDSPTPVLIDNQSALTLINSGNFSERSKHIGVRYRFICGLEEDGTIETEYIPTGDQVADILTKPLGREKFSRFTKLMGLLPPSNYGL